MISFVIPGEPFGKMAMKTALIGGHARAYSPKQNNFYMDRIINIINQLEEIKNSEEVLFSREVPVKITIKAYFKIPDSHYKFYRKENVSRYGKIGQEMLAGVVLPTKKPDLDNISKVICDGISHHGGVWFDDSQVVEEYLSKEYSNSPRVEVIVERLR